MPPPRSQSAAKRLAAAHCWPGDGRGALAFQPEAALSSVHMDPGQFNLFLFENYAPFFAGGSDDDCANVADAVASLSDAEWYASEPCVCVCV